MKQILLIFALPLILNGIEISNKQGASFDGEIIELILTTEGKESIKVRRSSDKRVYSIPLNSLSEPTLIAIIRAQGNLNKGKKQAPNIAAVPKKLNALPFVANNKTWKDFNDHKIVDFRSNPIRWNGKTVKVVGNFEYKSSFGESFSIEQGDDDIDVVYKELTRREKEEVLRQENFSNVLMRVSGRLEKHSFSANSFEIIAKKIEFLK
jgi:hypothetical protein|tara:strand:- start:140 stop:763 length:624 start_codon:yes stop_codon:yes gene_type:complete